MFNLADDKEVDIFYASGVYDNYICNKYYYTYLISNG